MLNTLQRYIFRRIAVITLASFFAILAVVWVTQIITQIDFATTLGQSVFSFFKIAAALTPQLAALVLPISVVVGAVHVFTTMNADSELAVMSASGVSRGMKAVPVFAVAALASAFILVSNHFIEPRSNRAMRELLVSAHSDFLTSFVREGVFTRLGKDMTIYVDHRLPGNVLQGIMVSDTRDENTSLVYYAQTGAIGEIDGQDVMVMTNGEIQRENTKDGTLSIIRFNSYALSLSQFVSAGGGVAFGPQEMETADLANPDPEDRIYKHAPDWFVAEFHRRMTDWLYPILFAYVALVISGQAYSHRQARFNTFILGLGAAMGYRSAAYAVYSANRSDSSLWWLFYAIPIAAIVISAVMYQLGISVRVPDRLARTVEALNARVRQWRIRSARAKAA
jgi:lipopolysaccharide export system permease protein